MAIMDTLLFITTILWCTVTTVSMVVVVEAFDHRPSQNQYQQHQGYNNNKYRGGGFGFGKRRQQQQRMAATTRSEAADLIDKIKRNKIDGDNGIDASDGDDPSFVPPMYKKSREERAFIEDILKYNFLFQDFGSKGTTSSSTTNTNDDDKDGNDDEQDAITTQESHKELIPLDHDSSDLHSHANIDLVHIVSSFEEVTFRKNSFLTKQGDVYDTDYLYIIYSGTCSVTIGGKRLEEPYGTMTRGALIGDLAMLYDTGRSATVLAETEVKAWRMHKRTYFHFLNNSATATMKENKTNQSTDTPVKSTTTSTTPKERMQKEVREIDAVIDQISGIKERYGGSIIQPFQPSRKWLWTRWKGTIMQHAWKTAASNMLLGVVFQFCFRYLCTQILKTPLTWSVGDIPDKSHPIVAKLTGLNGLWNVGLTLTTFTLTFFLSQAYSLWRDVYGKARDIQARLSDIGFLLASRAERNPKSKQYTARASKTLDDVAQCIRLFHALMWASYTRKFSKLLTPKGLSRLLSRGSMTRKQYECLIRDNNNDTVRSTTLQWIYIRLVQGINDGVFPQGTAFEEICTSKLTSLNDSMGGIGDSLDAKIPLAYGQFVQLLVDVFIILAPFALYSELGTWSIPAVGIITAFYSGMLDLSKILLFPLDNNVDDFYKDASVNMDVGVLIRESNRHSKLWKSGADDIPF